MKIIKKKKNKQRGGEPVRPTQRLRRPNSLTVVRVLQPSSAGAAQTGSPARYKRPAVRVSP
jgi:hypothetical protein